MITEAIPIANSNKNPVLNIGSCNNALLNRTAPNRTTDATAISAPFDFRYTAPIKNKNISTSRIIFIELQ